VVPSPEKGARIGESSEKGFTKGSLDELKCFYIIYFILLFSLPLGASSRKYHVNINLN
jgi:hypothetical protein